MTIPKNASSSIVKIVKPDISENASSSFLGVVCMHQDKLEMAVQHFLAQMK